jgi:peptide/nickel transport system permease protein
MAYFILRRLGQTALTVMGVMLITFLLFRGMDRDVASIILGQKATTQQKAQWRHTNGYDLPLIANVGHRYIQIEDKTAGAGPFSVADAPGSLATGAFQLYLEQKPASPAGSEQQNQRILGRYVWLLDDKTPIEKLTAGLKLADQYYHPKAGQSAGPASQMAPETQAVPETQVAKKLPAPEPAIIFSLSDGTTLAVDLAGVKTCGDLLGRINQQPGRLTACISEYSPMQFFDSQFFRHMKTSITFQSRSFRDDKSLTAIIADHGPYSLSVQVPVLALEWLIGLSIACYVAYFRGSLGDKIGVFLSVLGMCIPYLAILILGQWIMFHLAGGKYAYFSLSHPGGIYVPIALMVLAGLGGNVRFYRTIILDETGRDYVRTAKAKGVPLPSILFRHVLKNCMLPILTSLISTIPFLILGGLLVERIFGIPGLGDLMITSINNGDEPIMNGLVFLTSLVYCLAVLATDLCYAMFDPRIRLR